MSKDFIDMLETHSKSPSKKVSPTSRLIDFRKRRYEDKRATARKITPERSFERLLVYSRRPEFRLETSLRRLERISKECNGKKSKNVEAQVEKSLARELLPALEETVEWMYGLMLYFYRKGQVDAPSKEKLVRKTRNIRINITAINHF
eukprot:TRINITY_DN1920_c0_g1_i19.p1 TRINITY_DN1920_c0_g1~~TRINITY_DN1920_c0_g1_i19.p1  ORF type:complete len:148 (+),score=16.52 TRINITY_DN1920_c0_g1_i19:926-1369(+)